MAIMRTIVEEDFSSFAPGHLFADFTARGEYYCLPRPSYPNGWYDPINHTGGRPGGLSREQSTWRVRRSAGRKLLEQTVRPRHEPYLLVLGGRQVGSCQLECELRPGSRAACGVIFDYQHSRRFVAAVLEE
ncbi:MAG: hypothetical protein ACE5K7_05720, partial [Phycisphaerae bacterium]